MSEQSPFSLGPVAASIDEKVSALVESYKTFSAECDRVIAAVTAQKFDALSRVRAMLRPTGTQLSPNGTPRGKRGAPMTPLAVGHTRRDALTAVRTYQERATKARLSGEATIAAQNEKLVQKHQALVADCDLLLDTGLRIAKGRDVIRQAAQMLRDGNSVEQVLESLSGRIFEASAQAEKDAARRNAEADQEENILREFVHPTPAPMDANVVLGETREPREEPLEEPTLPTPEVPKPVETPVRRGPGRPKKIVAKTEEPVFETEDLPPPAIEPAAPASTPPELPPATPPELPPATPPEPPRAVSPRPVPSSTRSRPSPLARPVPTPTDAENISARLRARLTSRTTETPSK